MSGGVSKKPNPTKPSQNKENITWTGRGMGGKGRTGRGRVKNQGNTGEVRGGVGVLGEEEKEEIRSERPLY